MANGGVLFWLTKLESHGLFLLKSFSFILDIFKVDGNFVLI